MASTLTYDDQKLFAKLDEAVALGCRAAKVVIEAGRALAVIRDRQLYRDTAASWEAYLDRHSLTRRRADQLVAFATTLDAVSDAVSAKTGTAVPDLSERAVRPLVGMEIEDAAEAVIEALGTTQGITPATIKAAASKRKKPKAKAPRPQRFRVPGAVVEVVFNRKSDGRVIEALQAAIRQAEGGLEREAA